MSRCRSVAGRLFHSFGPATEKLLSPRRVSVRRTVRALASTKRRRRSPEWAYFDVLGSLSCHTIWWVAAFKRDGVSFARSRLSSYQYLRRNNADIAAAKFRY